MFKRLNVKFLFILALLCLVPARSAVALAAEADTYSIDVDVANQITTVYRNSDHAVVRQMICSTGTGDKTPRGRFNLEKSRPADRSEWYYIGNYNCYVKYPTRIAGSILFHSIPYAKMDMASIDAEALAQLGTRASHGCIRLRWQDAQWISVNCPDGTAVRIFTSPVKRTALRQKLLTQGYADMSGASYAQFTEDIPSGDGAQAMGRGDGGELIEALQRRLNGLGFYDGRASGVYDEETIAAVARYQAASGMSASGVAGAALIQKIMADDEVTGNYAGLAPGSSGPQVARLQEALKALGLYGGEIDGSYGAELAESVASFQRLFALEPTGAASTELQSAIFNGFSAPLAHGDRDPEVAALERALRALQYHAGDCDDTYGLDTVEAVRFFTRVNGMEERADATPQIQRAILSQYGACERAYGSGGYTLSLSDCETRVATARGEISLYGGMSSAGGAVATLSKGEQAVVLDAGRAWCELSVGGKTGYARTRLLELSTRVDKVAEFNAPEAVKADALVYGSEEGAASAPAATPASGVAAEGDEASVNGLVVEAYDEVPEESEVAYEFTDPAQAGHLAPVSRR